MRKESIQFLAGKSTVKAHSFLRTMALISPLRPEILILSTLIGLNASMVFASQSPRLGQPPRGIADRHVNLRESCRREIAGRYLTAFDEALQAERFVKVLEGEKQRTSTKLATENNHLKKLEIAANTGQFDATKATARDVQRGVVGALQNHLEQIDVQLPTARQKATLKAGEVAIIKRRITPVFKVAQATKLKNDGKEELPPAGQGYPFKVEYTGTCPRYQYQCPLPEPHAVALQQMFPDHELPEACKRYANIR